MWSQDGTVLSQYLQTLFPQPGQTNLLDAVHSMVKHITDKAQQDNLPTVRKVIVLITDGEDRKSKIKEKELLAELHQQQIKVYAIGLVQELDQGYMINPKNKATRFLKKVSKETAGKAIFPKSNSGDVQALLNELFAPAQ